MPDKKISNNEQIEAALQLDGNPDRISEFYEDWAGRYNLDVDSEDYSAPAIAAKLLQQNLSDTHGKLLDAGCGTGLVGIELHQLGYGDIDGFDLSESMATQAIATGMYKNVRSGIDMMRAHSSYPEACYDAILAVGVFTLGHVPPQALSVLMQLTRPGGLMVISTRSHYYDQTCYQQVADKLIADGQMTLVQLLEHAPYSNDGDAHYWVFRKSG